MQIHGNFTGGNIRLISADENTVTLENEYRDSYDGWFYWAFCIENAENRTITFKLQKDRLGYFGPAVSHDLKNWSWLGTGARSNEGDSFVYSFAPGENRVYFAHDMLYHPDRFFEFAKKLGLPTEELCTGYKGSSIPAVKFGSGEISIVLTARHHACEATGSYVLEGVLEELYTKPIPNTKIFCVPFVDFEGVIRGDQGKDRSPHDHNRDYLPLRENSIYPECIAIMDYVIQNKCHYAFDFHSPWHIGGRNDKVFIVKNPVHNDIIHGFSEIFEKKISEGSMKYSPADDIAAGEDWNVFAYNCSNFMSSRKENKLAFSLETAYFGTEDNVISAEKAIELGRCFVAALREYIEG
ncbi:MAG: hypothetical protein II350_08590 [Clostridia bacterium]|nr:hypothetical protein [Clostridia bacterium]